MKRTNNLYDGKTKHLVRRAKCIKYCRIENKKINFWELPKHKMTNLPYECQPEEKIEFSVKKNGFFGWIKSIFGKR